MDTYDKVAECVRDFWKKSIPQDVVVFFRQKYSFENEWEICEEVISAISSDDYEFMEFLNDFCEGQTDFMLEKIVPLSDILKCYRRKELDTAGGVK